MPRRRKLTPRLGELVLCRLGDRPDAIPLATVAAGEHVAYSPDLQSRFVIVDDGGGNSLGNSG